MSKNRKKIEIFEIDIGHRRFKWSNLGNDVGEVEELADEELEGVGGVSASMSAPVFNQRVDLGLFYLLVQQRFLKNISHFEKNYFTF